MNRCKVLLSVTLQSDHQQPTKPRLTNFQLLLTIYHDSDTLRTEYRTFLKPKRRLAGSCLQRAAYGQAESARNFRKREGVQSRCATACETR